MKRNRSLATRFANSSFEASTSDSRPAMSACAHGQPADVRGQAAGMWQAPGMLHPAPVAAGTRQGLDRDPEACSPHGCGSLIVRPRPLQREAVAGRCVAHRATIAPAAGADLRTKGGVTAVQSSPAGGSALFPRGTCSHGLA